MKKKLDEAFKTHSQAPHSKASDEALLAAMDKWLDKKEKAPSKSRYDLVIEMYEQLSDVIKENYGSSDPVLMS